MKTIDEIRMNFVKAEGLFRLMIINISIFLVIGLIKVITYLTGSGNGLIHSIIDVLAMKAYLPGFIQQPWSLITYMFIHEDFLHILFNMLVLFWTGKIFCDFLNSKKLVVVYLLGGISGALLYMLAYNFFPAFSQSLVISKLIGASAGVIAILAAIATYLPNYAVHLFLFGAVRLKYLAAFLILLYVISIPDGNAGGNISHLGGAVFGFTYIKLLRAGTDSGRWLEFLLDSILRLTKPPDKFKVVHRSATQAGKINVPRGASSQETIDAILDKISRSGYSSLTKSEREILFNASKNKE